MGYKTNHSLVMDPPLTGEQIARALFPDHDYDDPDIEHPDWYWIDSGMTFVMGQPNEKGECPCHGEGKWDEDPDMLKISAAYPEVRFTLRVGDDLDAPWYIKYYLGGEMADVYPEVIFPPNPLWSDDEDAG